MKSLFLIFSVAVLLFVFPAHAQNGTLNPAIQEMGTISCPGHTFDCGNPFSERDKVLSAANQCINTIFGIRESILDGFGADDKENCAIAKNPSYEDAGTKIWAVCCLKPVKGRKDCKLSCTRYISGNGMIIGPETPGP